jgi:uncharacterized protein (DUF608 family)
MKPPPEIKRDGEAQPARVLGRRDLLKTAAWGVAALTARSGPAAAQSPGRASAIAEDNAPAAQQMTALSLRGEPAVYRGDDLMWIGMPVSGITTGQLYLSGDGRLWCWDIFNATEPEGDSRHYAYPIAAESSLEQGFSLRVEGGGAAARRALSRQGFADVAFRGEYPIGYVDYRDSGCPLRVQLEAFSPFVPLQVDDSSLPATVMRFTLVNESSHRVTGDVTGTLENAVARSAEVCQPVRRFNTIERHDRLLTLSCRADVDSSKRWPDAGTMGLALLAATDADIGTERIGGAPGEQDKLVGSLTRAFSLAPGETHAATFVVVWCFPNLAWPGLKTPGGRHYATRFDSAAAVARYLAANFERLYAQTTLWHDTWRDSTLPHWLLERTLLNVSTLATSTAMRFGDGRFYADEGVRGGGGTCTHVWHYEQAMGRLFPELDVLLRERVDFNSDIALRPDGMIEHRGEYDLGPAVDGQAGTILRALRDHQTFHDDAFLQRNWPAIRKATQWLIDQPGGEDGLLEGAQPNTLDSSWYGPVAWLSGLYLAALRAAEEMALDAGDRQFAQRCRGIFEVGQRSFVSRLFEGGYFVNRPDPRHPEAINSGTGCAIDQVLGQSWAFQLGLGRVLPERETRSALAALWRYNFIRDVGPYRAVNKPGRWYAMPGEAGLLMCTFPRPDWTYDRAKGVGGNAFLSGYFNECMTGFEHQVAAHMIWEGMVEEGLAIERAIHDRYHPSCRNPWNEIEAADHYARAMASYGVFLAACGFEYHGPKGYLGFAPRITPEAFKCAFTAAQGWGSFAQRVDDHRQVATLELKWGVLRIRTLSLAPVRASHPVRVRATVNGSHLPAGLALVEGRARVTLSQDAHLSAGDQLSVELS